MFFHFCFSMLNCSLGFYVSELRASWTTTLLSIELAKPDRKPNAPTTRPMARAIYNQLRMHIALLVITTTPTGVVLKDIAIGAGGLRFDSRVSQIEHSVANDSPPLQRFF